MRVRLRGPLRRNPEARVLAGVCGGISEATGIDVTLVRIGFVLLTLGSGVGVLAYAIAWLLLPLEGETTNILSRAVTDRRGIRLVIAVIPAVVVVQVVTSVLHVGYVGSLGWPVLLAVGIAILIRRNASEKERLWINDDLMPMLQTGGGLQGRRKLVARLAVGIALGAGGLLVLILGHPSGAALRPIGGSLLVVAAIVVIFGPWWLSVVRDLMSERQARAMAEERAQMAAHVHDSVLQTLALIQRSADDPANVMRLARAQERELRSWLFEGRPPGTIGEDATTLAEGIGVLQRQVEADHGIAIQVVVVGDCGLDDGLRALLDASREAAVNAAKWSGAPQVSLYAEVERDAVKVYVRDRGRGFDPETVPADRQGIARSIRARMARVGGSAVIRSSPGDGAEVQLSMPRREFVR
jgi:signal transduction histidine kinase